MNMNVNLNMDDVRAQVDQCVYAVYEKCIDEYEKGRMQQSEVDKYLRSIAWQSEHLQYYYKSLEDRKFFETLSESELNEIWQGS